MAFDWTSSASSFTIDGTGAGGTITSGGGDIADVSNITIKHVSFTDAVDIGAGSNMNLVFDGDHFNSNGTTFSMGASSCTGEPARIHVSYDNGATASGVTVENSTFIDPAGGISNAMDGIQTGSGMVIRNNLFENILDLNGCAHVDAIQGVGATGVVVEGNLFANTADGFVDFDDSTGDTVTDNACYGLERNACVTLYADLGSVAEHNTGGAGMRSVELDAKTGHRNGSGTIVRDNVGPVSIANSTPAVDTNNLFSGAKAPNINGSPTFGGGASPTTWSGFELAPGSIGYDAGTDGSSIGIRASAGGPPGQ
jgi:hypothetical protein